MTYDEIVKRINKEEERLSLEKEENKERTQNRNASITLGVSIAIFVISFIAQCFYKFLPINVINALLIIMGITSIINFCIEVIAGIEGFDIEILLIVGIIFQLLFLIGAPILYFVSDFPIKSVLSAFLFGLIPTLILLLINASCVDEKGFNYDNL